MRKTSLEGIFIGETYIPGNMNVWTPQYVIARSEVVYEKPLEFVSERWYSMSSMVKESAGYAPFLTGMGKLKYSCSELTNTIIGPYVYIGRPLALMEMRLVIADVISRFNFEFPSGKDSSDFINHTKDHFVWTIFDLEICFRARS